jgi:3-amino-5-hydroxybenzoate synthase
MTDLALHGGPPLRTTPFPSWPQFDDGERDGLGRALDQGEWWRVGGKEVTLLEGEFAAFHDAPAAIAVTNGTAALELALELLGIGPGDEVLVPAFTFAATSIAVQRRQAVAVPVDIDLDTYCMAPGATADAAGSRAAVLVPVHMAGHVSDMDALGDLAAARGMTMVQDAAHAHGAEWKGRKLGELGTLAAFSFQNGKLMTAGEGGALLLPDHVPFSEAFARHSCGRPIGDRWYDHRSASGNLRLNEFSAAVLRAQLARLPRQLDRRERAWSVLAAALAKLRGVVPQGRDVRCTVDSHYMAMFRLDPEVHAGLDRNLVVDALIAEGIPAFANYPPVYRTGSFWPGGPDPTAEADLAARCPHAELIGAQGIWVHHRTLLAGDEDVLDVARALDRVLIGLGRP